MTHAIVKLPGEAGWEFEVYVNGVQQEPGVDFYLAGRDLIFEGPLRRDHLSRLRRLLGACGLRTYRQDDTIDIRYEVNGEIRLRHAATITLDDDSDGMT